MFIVSNVWTIRACRALVQIPKLDCCISKIRAAHRQTISHMLAKFRVNRSDNFVFRNQFHGAESCGSKPKRVTTVNFSQLRKHSQSASQSASQPATQPTEPNFLTHEKRPFGNRRVAPTKNPSNPAGQSANQASRPYNHVMTSNMCLHPIGFQNYWPLSGFVDVCIQKKTRHQLRSLIALVKQKSVYQFCSRNSDSTHR